MRHWFCGVPFLLALSGCPKAAEKDANPSKPSTCSADDLTAVGERLKGMEAGKAAKEVWPALQEACGSALPDAAVAAYTPPEKPKGASVPDLGKDFNELVLAVCSEYPELESSMWGVEGLARSKKVYAGCDFGRFDVMSEDELVVTQTGGISTWAVHGWLLEQGVEPSAAKPITRALFGLAERRFMLAKFYEGEKLPRASGKPVEAGTYVWIGSSGVYLDTPVPVAEIVEGELGKYDKKGWTIPRVEEMLREEVARARAAAAEGQYDPWHRLNVAAHADAPFGVLLQVLHSAHKGLYPKLSLLVDDSATGSIRQLEVHEPILESSRYDAMRGPSSERSLAPSVSRREPAVTVELTESGFSVSVGRIASGEPKAGTDNFELIGTFAKAIKKEDPSIDLLVISAPGQTPIQRVMDAIEGAGGELPRVAFRPSDAHDQGD